MSLLHDKNMWQGRKDAHIVHDDFIQKYKQSIWMKYNKDKIWDLQKINSIMKYNQAWEQQLFELTLNLEKQYDWC